MLVSRQHSATASTQSQLGFPGDIADLLRQGILAQPDLTRDARRVAVGPGSLDKYPPRMGVACLGDSSLTARASVGAGNNRESMWKYRFCFEQYRTLPACLSQGCALVSAKGSSTSVFLRNTGGRALYFASASEIADEQDLPPAWNLQRPSTL
jgi:hypothetical protein